MRKFIFLALFPLMLPAFSIAASFNQLDDFEDGSTSGWSRNGQGTVSNVSSNGPAGPNDSFLLLTANSFHLGAKNTTQWAGDHLATGSEAIQMDLKHIILNNDPLNIRIVVFGPGGTWASKDVTEAIPTNQWKSYMFKLDTDHMVHLIGGTTNLNDTLQNVSTLHMRHDYATPTLPGTHPPHITESLGVDNIQALPRQTQLATLVVSNNAATVALSGLIPGLSNIVQTTDNLLNSWTNTTEFIPASETTNITVTLDGPEGYIRTITPIP